MPNILNFTTGLLEFDRFSDPLIGKLVTHRDQFIPEKGEPVIVVPKMPPVIRLNAECIQEYVTENTGRFIGVNAILFFTCLEGYLTFKENESIKACADYRSKFNKRSPGMKSEMVYVMAGFMGSFEVKLDLGRRKNIPVNSETHGSIVKLADRLGMEIGALACLCMMHTLTRMHVTNEEQVEEMSRMVNSFLERIAIRSEGLAALFERYKI